MIGSLVVSLTTYILKKYKSAIVIVFFVSTSDFIEEFVIVRGFNFVYVSRFIGFNPHLRISDVFNIFFEFILELVRWLSKGKFFFKIKLNISASKRPRSLLLSGVF